VAVWRIVADDGWRRSATNGQDRRGGRVSSRRSRAGPRTLPSGRAARGGPLRRPWWVEKGRCGVSGAGARRSGAVGPETGLRTGGGQRWRGGRRLGSSPGCRTLSAGPEPGVRSRAGAPASAAGWRNKRPRFDGEGRDARVACRLRRQPRRGCPWRRRQVDGNPGRGRRRSWCRDRSDDGLGGHRRSGQGSRQQAGEDQGHWGCGAGGPG